MYPCIDINMPISHTTVPKITLKATDLTSICGCFHFLSTCELFDIFGISQIALSSE